MGSVARPGKYETEPLGCWGRAKELRLSHYKDLAAARELQAEALAAAAEAGPSEERDEQVAELKAFDETLREK